jgi:hypothetical protein
MRQGVVVLRALSMDAKRRLRPEIVAVPHWRGYSEVAVCTFPAD